jgi:hypothetical protein
VCQCKKERNENARKEGKEEQRKPHRTNTGRKGKWKGRIKEVRKRLDIGK